MLGLCSDLIPSREFIQHLVWRDSFWYQLWHIDVVRCISLSFYLLVIHKAACVVHSAAHSPKAWIIILLVNYDKDFLYIHPAWKQHASTNMSALIMHRLLWAFTIRYTLAGIWQARMFTFITRPPSSSYLSDTDGESCNAPYKTKIHKHCVHYLNLCK